jgi:hypothetical protein
MRIATCLLLTASLLAAREKPAPADAAPDSAGGALAILQARCVKCHGADKPKAKLDLASLEGISRGSRRGAVVSAGKLGESLLWQMVQENRMPPKQPLPDAERLVLRRWIEEGAQGLKATDIQAGPFRPPVRPPVPGVRQSEHLRTDLDAFIQEALEENGLDLGAEADRATLVRRVSFDLTGLPPTPADLQAFLADQSPDAYERLVERYLASPHYGERWGKHWLDAAGYADSNGYFDADSDRPLAYRYRDWVVRSFNQDKPYDRFVTEQLAGDELAGYVPGGDVTPSMTELLTATHFLRNAPDGTGESDGNEDEVRTDRYSVLEGTLQITMNCILGITIQCARCHSHKFEPITHEEYYRLQAVFVPAYNPERWIKPAERLVAVAPATQRQEYERRNARIGRQVAALKASLREIAEPLREQVIEECLKNLEAATREAVLAAFATPQKDRSSKQKELLQAHVEPLKIGDDDLIKRFPEFGPVREQIRKAIAEREKERPRPLEMLSVLVQTDPNPPVHHHLLLRGQHNAPGPAVQPGVPAAFCTAANVYALFPSPQPFSVEDQRLRSDRKPSTGRRTTLARWMTSPDNPLFARVMVNRIWQHHFGVGLVATPNNLGRSGAPPSHPELLDFLATEFFRSGWSVKAMHRRILNSATYRQASAFRANADRVDPDNRLLWRFPLRRLDAEALRDAMLAVSGELDCRLGGPYVPTLRTGEGSVDVDKKHAGARRRSIYLQQRRSQDVTLLELFDKPRMTPSCSARNTSTTPLQGLALLNSEFARARARAFAERLEREGGADDGQRLVRALRLAAGREPAAKETAAARRFLVTQRALYAKENDANQRAWTDLCQMILAGNLFLYIE